MCKVLLPSFQNFDGENVSNFQRQGGRKTVESEKVYFNRNSKNSFYTVVMLIRRMMAQKLLVRLKYTN
jgi:hypothetical protein